MRNELNDFLKLPERPENSHKGTFGKILNIAGSKNYSGAAILSSLSALKSGAGYLTLACPESIVSSVSSYSPDITFLPLKEEKGDSFYLNNIKLISQKLNEFDVLSVGCGLTTDENVSKFLLKVLENTKIPTVIDADALNIISKYEVEKLNISSIITPHPKELSRLLKTDVQIIQSNRENYCKAAAIKYNTICVLKGHNTVISDGNNIYINHTGNSSLAKAGSGDVLTGIISGFLAQGCSFFQAAVLGVYIHALCGELASVDLTEYSVLASDLLNYIPKAIKKLM